MAKKVLTLIKLQIPGGQANPAPPVGPALGQHGVNIMEFCKAFNAQTAQANGRITPVEITVFEDRSFTFITKTPPAAVLIKEALNTREGLVRAEPRQGRAPDARPGAPDRRDEARGPERPRRRAGDAGRRRNGALHGRGDGHPLMAGHGKRYREARVEDRPRADVLAGRGRAHAQGERGREVRRDRRGALQPRPQRPPRRPAAPRDAHAPARQRQGGARRRLRRGREGARGGRGRSGRRRDADLAKQIEEGFDDFDVTIATPDQMSVVGRLGRILGPRGKMPNPKTGTVTMDVGKAVADSKGGKLEYRTDRGANVHVAIGRKSFEPSAAARELRGAGRRDRAREARGREGPLHPIDHADEHHGPRHPRRPGEDAGHRGGARGGNRSRTRLGQTARRPRPPAVPARSACPRSGPVEGSGGTGRFHQRPGTTRRGQKSSIGAAAFSESPLAARGPADRRA